MQPIFFILFSFQQLNFLPLMLLTLGDITNMMINSQPLLALWQYFNIFTAASPFSDKPVWYVDSHAYETHVSKIIPVGLLSICYSLCQICDMKKWQYFTAVFSNQTYCYSLRSKYIHILGNIYLFYIISNIFWPRLSHNQGAKIQGNHTVHETGHITH